MAFSVVMPALEMAQETGKLIAWRKKEGDRVTKGEPLLEIETDKAVVEVEAPADGILAGIKACSGRRYSRRPDHRVDRRTRRTTSGRKRIGCAGGTSWIAREDRAFPRRGSKLSSHAQAPHPVQEFLPRLAASPRNWASISPPCAAPVPAEKFSLRMCRPLPQRPLNRASAAKRNPEASKFPARSAASWPSAPRRAGPPSLTSS